MKLSLALKKINNSMLFKDLVNKFVSVRLSWELALALVSEETNVLDSRYLIDKLAENEQVKSKPHFLLKLRVCNTYHISIHPFNYLIFIKHLVCVGP